MAPRKPAVPTLERTIHFYRVAPVVPGPGFVFDPAKIVQHLAGLPFTSAGRYLEDAEGNATCAWVDVARSHDRMRFGFVRRSNFPQVEEGGNLTDLNLPAHAGLAEHTHVVFFANRILGADFNFYGPRISRLSQYLPVKAPAFCSSIQIRPLIRKDVRQKLKELHELVLFRLKIQASYAEVVRQADEDLGAAFKAAGTKADEVEVVLRPTPYSGGLLSSDLFKTIRGLVGRPDLREAASAFDIKATNKQSGKREAVDLLSDELIAKRKIAKLNKKSRTLIASSAYAAIEEAYDELKGELELAAEVEDV